MKIKTKLLLLLIIGASVPLLLSHLFVAQVTVTNIEKMVHGDMFTVVNGLAGRIDDRLRWILGGVAMTVETVPFESLQRDELSRALELPYRQNVDTTIWTMLDDSGKAVASSYKPSKALAKLLGREAVAEGDLDKFAQNIPLKLSLKESLALGPGYFSVNGSPRVAAAQSFPISGGEKQWVLAAEISLSLICQMLDDVKDKQGGKAVLLSTHGKLICNGKQEYQYSGIAKQKTGETSFVNISNVNYVYTVSDIATTGWKLVLMQPENKVMAPVFSSVTWIIMWIVVAVVIAVIGGMILVKTITSPLAALELASKQIAQGNYDQVIENRSSDEIGVLSSSFNKMAAEIRAWNTELKKRVRARTKELKEAQEQIIRTQKVAAIGELGAGVAHEVNNPLTGIIGTAQLMMAEEEVGSVKSKGLIDIIGQARRVAEIVDTLLRLAQSQVSTDMSKVDPCQILKMAVSMYAVRLEERNIVINWKLASDCYVHAITSDLQLAFNHIIDNAVRAMESGGTLTIEVAKVEGGAVSIGIEDTGIGMDEDVRSRAIDPFYSGSKLGAGSKGLGLTMVQNVVIEHEGKMVIESEPSKGTTIKVYLPGAVEISKC